MTEINLNEIENVVNTKFFTPIVIPPEQQIEFRSVQDVRSFSRGTGDLPAHVMMNRMMEAFFGHHSTCLIGDMKGVVKMFGRLLSGWVERLYMVNQSLAPEDDYFEPYIHEKRVHFDQMYKNGNDDVKQAIAAQRLAFHAHHRAKNEIEILVSKYAFKMASRYYRVSQTMSRDHIIKYMKFRLAFIDRWYDTVGSIAMKEIVPDVLVASLDARTVAMNVFPQHKEFYADELDDRLQSYIKWHKKASRDAIAEAMKLKDPVYLQSVQNEWDSALLYAKSLHDGMMEMAHDMDEYEDDDFIVDDDEIIEDDEDIAEQNKRLDDSMFRDRAEKQSQRYDRMNVYNDDATEEEIEAYLRKQDKKQRKMEKRLAKFMDQTEEGSDEDA